MRKIKKGPHRQRLKKNLKGGCETSRKGVMPNASTLNTMARKTSPKGKKCGKLTTGLKNCHKKKKKEATQRAPSNTIGKKTQKPGPTGGQNQAVKEKTRTKLQTGSGTNPQEKTEPRPNLNGGGGGPAKNRDPKNCTPQAKSVESGKKAPTKNAGRLRQPLKRQATEKSKTGGGEKTSHVNQ